MRKTKKNKKGGSSTNAPEVKPENNVVKPKKSMKNRAKNAASSVASGIGKAASWIGNKLSLKKKK